MAYILFDEKYEEDYTHGIMKGHVNSVEDLNLETSGQKYIKPDRFYNKDYVGAIKGSWEGIEEEKRYFYKIQSYSVTDEVYFQEQCLLLNNNTWILEYIRSGYKEIWLLDENNNIIDYGYKYLKNYRVNIYLKTDIEYLVDTVPVWLYENDKYIFYSVKSGRGIKIARLIDIRTDEVISEYIVGEISEFPPRPNVPSSPDIPPYDWGEEPTEKYAKAKWKARNFVKRQMNVANFNINPSYDEIYDENHTDMVMIGSITGINDPVVKWNNYIDAPYYSFDYKGIVQGNWYSKFDIDNYQINLYVISDIKYFICSCQINEDGTWVSTKEVSTGVKEIQLIDKRTGKVIEYAYPILENYYIRTYSYSDTEYSTDNCKIFLMNNQYKFYSADAAKFGYKVCKIFNRAGNVVGISSGYSNINYGRIPASFLIPEDDWNYDKDGSNALHKHGYMLNNRSFIYDIGLALLLFTLEGDFDTCKEMMNRMAYEQNEDGSFNFSYDLYIGQLFESYKRTGAIGWLVWGMCYYIMISGDYSYNDMLRKVGDWIIDRQVRDINDFRYGLLKGGQGAYGDNYEYIDIEIEWCSTEHNCSVLQALTGLSLILGDNKYKECAKEIKKAIYNRLYDEENGRFYQGCSANGIDEAWALDCSTWAGKTMLSILEEKIPEECVKSTYNHYLLENKTILKSKTRENYNMTYYLNEDETVAGFKPYSLGYDNPPQLVWTEGTLGMVALLLAVGRRSEAFYYIDETIKLQECNGSTGGVIYTTETWASMPWEFHVWESVVSSCWLYIALSDFNVLFPHTFKLLDTFDMSYEFKELYGGEIKSILSKRD